eukprot:TRINITY_DN3886_c0_g1_i1.p2 TRINITY_DN3886_c0_g1~~TRINITY_DN3886_c0_g1_i1.p2  ORF type:complete len:117 (-),score=57.55 TRINITY_DN3886_c0_g1_i1:133-483(-)
MSTAEEESGLRNFRDFLTVYNQMSEMCFQRCVVSMNSRQLTDEEQACADVCAEKQMKFNNRIMGVYLAEQPKATERKMKEAEEQAEAAVARLKERGVDTDNLTPEDVAKEAMLGKK